MNVRRPVVALLTALTLIGGPATLTACSAAGGGTERNDGDSSDNETGNTSGDNPGGVSEGNVPDNDDNENDNETGDDEGNSGSDNDSDG